MESIVTIKQLKNGKDEHQVSALERYSQISLIRTPKGQNQVSTSQKWSYYRGRECMMFVISGTKQTVGNREASVL